MRRVLFILLIVGMYFQVLSPHRLIASSPVYTDDAYYWPAADTLLPAEPVYDRRARALVFTEDTTCYNDTIHL
jgi:hypothetical protein